MPTSATGRSTAERRRAAGFTLLELVVVLAILGTLVGIVGIAVPDRARARLDAELERLLGALEDCRQGAVLSGMPYGLATDGERYALERYRGRWQPLPGAAPGERALPQDIFLSVPAVPVDAPAAPAVICLPSGETLLPATLWH